MAPLPPMTLFPPSPTLKFAQDTKLNNAVKTAVDGFATASKTVPAFRIAIIDLGDEKSTSTLKFGAHNGDTVDFIASEAKLIALYSAFALRDMVERFAVMRGMRFLLAKGKQVFAGGPKPPVVPDLFTALHAELDAHILAAADGALRALPRDELLPKYSAMFVAPISGKVDFKPSFRDTMRQMIVPSSNSGASKVIMSVGYAYISGAMKAADLFVGGKGPWLSADFANHYHALINSTNDNAVGQAGTALSMAKLLSILLTGGVSIRADSFTDMQKLLADAVDGPDTPLLTRKPEDGFTDPADTDATQPRLRIRRKTELTHIKLGQDWLKPKNGGLMVWSEAFRLKDLGKAGRTYAVSYQNLLTSQVAPVSMAWVIRRAIAEYER